MKILHIRIEEFEMLNANDEDEDAMMRHNLKKAKHHYEELEEKYHHLDGEFCHFKR